MALMPSVAGCYGERTTSVLMWMDSGAGPRVGCPRKMQRGHHLVEIVLLIEDDADALPDGARGGAGSDGCGKGTL